MDINIFLLCYNESVLLPHVFKHYNKYLPSCKVTIYDNESTDNSVEIAKSFGWNVISWKSNNIMNEGLQIQLRNTIWKDVKDGWIIMADMDEFLCVTENQLLEEMNKGTTILKIQGYEMIGESNTIDLSDIDLQEIKKYVINIGESKNLCFLREKIIDMNYGPGSHTCKPNGTIIYSSNIYLNKHMSYLGLIFFITKNKNRYIRSNQNRLRGWSVHYKNNLYKIREDYMNKIKNCKIIE